MRAMCAAIAACFVTATLSAQWPAFIRPDVPRTADGKPDLSAPPPRLANGKPVQRRAAVHAVGRRGPQAADSVELER